MARCNDHKPRKSPYTDTTSGRENHPTTTNHSPYYGTSAIITTAPVTRTLRDLKQALNVPYLFVVLRAKKFFDNDSNLRSILPAILLEVCPLLVGGMKRAAATKTSITSLDTDDNRNPPTG